MCEDLRFLHIEGDIQIQMLPDKEFYLRIKMKSLQSEGNILKYHKLTLSTIMKTLKRYYMIF